MPLFNPIPAGLGAEDRGGVSGVLSNAQPGYSRTLVPKLQLGNQGSSPRRVGRVLTRILA